MDRMRKLMDEQMMYMERTMFEMRPVTADDDILKNDIVLPVKGLVF